MRRRVTVWDGGSDLGWRRRRVVCDNGAFLVPGRASSVIAAVFFVLLPSLEADWHIPSRLRASKRPVSLDTTVVTNRLLLRGCLSRGLGAHGGWGSSSASGARRYEETEERRANTVSG
jgi:hypothetical protein